MIGMADCDNKPQNPRSEYITWEAGSEDGQSCMRDLKTLTTATRKRVMGGGKPC